MPINREIATEYRTQLRNGDDFSGGAGFSVNLTGNAMTAVQATLNITVGWYAEADSIDTWNVKATTIQRTTGSFFDDGFFVGQKFGYISAWSTDNTTPIDFEATIDSISADGSLLTFTVTAGAVTPDASADDVGIRAIGNAPENKLTGVLYRYGLNENAEPFTTASKIAGVNNRYQAKDVGLGGSTVPVSMDPQGTLLTWQTGSATAAFVSDSQFDQVYEIVHEFIISPWYLQGQENGIDGNLPPVYFAGNRCLKHVFDIELRPILSNPNQTIEIRLDDINGFTGWFNENLNGEPADYSLVSVAYTDTTSTATVTGIQPDKRTTAVIVIQRNSGNFPAGTKSGALLSFLAPQSRYTSAVGTAIDAFLYDSAYHIEGSGASTETGIIKSIDSSIASDQLTITIETEYTTAQTEIISGGSTVFSGASYLLAVDVGDLIFDNPASDSVSVVVDLNEYTAPSFIDGLLSFTRFNVLVHDETAGVDAGNTSATAWNQDGILIDFAFDLDLAKSSFLNSLIFKLVAFDTVSESSFELDRYAIDVSGVVVSTGVQQIEIDQSRGYILASNSQFNDVFITTGSRVADVQSYSGYFAQKIKWQDWISNISADSVFYDSAEPNNNLNYKSSNYSNISNYQIRVICETDLTGVETGISGTGYETGSTGDLTINNYGIAVDSWTAVCSLHDPDTDANTGGVILLEKDTVFRVTWQNSVQGNDLSGLDAMHRIQQTLSAGDDIQEFSSLKEPATGIILKPVSGETLLKVTQLAPDFVVTECLIDKDKITAGAVYNLSYKLERK